MEKYTFPVYITLPAESEEQARTLLKGMLNSEHILPISYTIGRAITIPPTKEGASCVKGTA